MLVKGGAGIDYIIFFLFRNKKPSDTMEALKGHVKFLKTVCVSPNKDLRIS